jgi:outer membrane lipoprotein-sorting protein
MIKEYNKGISDYKDVREGQDIMIPNFYAKMTVMYIDKQNLLPILIRAYDDKGLFESYEYLNLQVNPKIAPEEFTKGYKDYHF